MILKLRKIMMLFNNIVISNLLMSVLNIIPNIIR